MKIGDPVIQQLGFVGDLFQLKVAFPVFDLEECDDLPDLAEQAIKEVGKYGAILKFRAEDLPAHPRSGELIHINLGHMNRDYETDVARLVESIIEAYNCVASAPDGSLSSTDAWGMAAAYVAEFTMRQLFKNKVIERRHASPVFTATGGDHSDINGWNDPYEDFIRASGDCVCEECKDFYRNHPSDKRRLGYDNKPFLRVLCDGRRVKL